ncbi:MAG: hypothetical protein LBD49_02850 [Oscillospiraceae bacterium]|jgi:uncharacterized membrane protein YjdF|nr:hypothetical protein [Oscillospiraceae bacterium]
MRRGIKRNPRLFALYAVLRVFVAGVLTAQIFNANWENVLMCVLTLALFTIPSFFEKRVKIDVPDTLEAAVLFFIFAAEILGEVHGCYENIAVWDMMLHTANGFLAAAIGLALIDILNREDRFAISLSPVFVAVFAFCFSMTIGVVWEFFEFSMDTLFGADMQKNTVLAGGYVDIGLYDTMKDLIVNFIGAAVFSALGYFYIKHRGEGRGGRFVRRFILTKIGEHPDEDGA